MFNYRILTAALAANLLFLATGVIQLAFSLIVHQRMNDMPTDGRQAARNLFYQQLPLVAGMINGILIIVVCLLSLPGLLSPKLRGWLKVNTYLIAACAVFTLALGCYLWIMTLTMTSIFYEIYIEQEPSVQGLLQSSFQCCGYYNATMPAFITDPTCPSPAGAALVGGCAHLVAGFLDRFADDIFTALFGMTAAHFVYGLCIACLLKDRKEAERYREIDSKRDWAHI